MDIGIWEFLGILKGLWSFRKWKFGPSTFIFGGVTLHLWHVTCSKSFFSEQDFIESVFQMVCFNSLQNCYNWDSEHWPHRKRVQEKSWSWKIDAKFNFLNCSCRSEQNILGHPKNVVTATLWCSVTSVPKTGSTRCLFVSCNRAGPYPIASSHHTFCFF